MARRTKRNAEFGHDLNYRGGDLFVRASDFTEYVDTFLAPIERVHGPIPRISIADCDRAGGAAFACADRAQNIGGFRFYLRELHVSESLEIFDGRHVVGQVNFSGNVYIPILGSCLDTWMSLTPSEIITQGEGIRAAEGSVAIGGLGIGWFARRVLEQSSVSQVTIVELSKELIDFFGEPLRRDFGSRVRLVHGDAFKAIRPVRYDSVLFDIWRGCGQSAQDERWKEIARRHRNAWAW